MSGPPKKGAYSIRLCDLPSVLKHRICTQVQVASAPLDKFLEEYRQRAADARDERRAVYHTTYSQTLATSGDEKQARQAACAASRAFAHGRRKQQQTDEAFEFDLADHGTIKIKATARQIAGMCKEIQRRSRYGKPFDIKRMALFDDEPPTQSRSRAVQNAGGKWPRAIERGALPTTAEMLMMRTARRLQKRLRAAGTINLTP